MHIIHIKKNSNGGAMSRRWTDSRIRAPKELSPDGHSRILRPSRLMRASMVIDSHVEELCRRLGIRPPGSSFPSSPSGVGRGHGKSVGSAGPRLGRSDPHPSTRDNFTGSPGRPRRHQIRSRSLGDVNRAVQNSSRTPLQYSSVGASKFTRFATAYKLVRRGSIGIPGDAGREVHCHSYHADENEVRYSRFFHQNNFSPLDDIDIQRGGSLMVPECQQSYPFLANGVSTTKLYGNQKIDQTERIRQHYGLKEEWIEHRRLRNLSAGKDVAHVNSGNAHPLGEKDMGATQSSAGSSSGSYWKSFRRRKRRHCSPFHASAPSLPSLHTSKHTAGAAFFLLGDGPDGHWNAPQTTLMPPQMLPSEHAGRLLSDFSGASESTTTVPRTENIGITQKKRTSGVLSTQTSRAYGLHESHISAMSSPSVEVLEDLAISFSTASMRPASVETAGQTSMDLPRHRTSLQRESVSTLSLGPEVSPSSFGYSGHMDNINMVGGTFLSRALTSEATKKCPKAQKRSWFSDRKVMRARRGAGRPPRAVPLSSQRAILRVCALPQRHSAPSGGASAMLGLPEEGKAASSPRSCPRDGFNHHEPSPINGQRANRRIGTRLFIGKERDTGAPCAIRSFVITAGMLQGLLGRLEGYLSAMRERAAADAAPPPPSCLRAACPTMQSVLDTSADGSINQCGVVAKPEEEAGGGTRPTFSTASSGACVEPDARDKLPSEASRCHLPSQGLHDVLESASLDFSRYELLPEYNAYSKPFKGECSSIHPDLPRKIPIGGRDKVISDNRSMERVRARAARAEHPLEDRGDDHNAVSTLPGCGGESPNGPAPPRGLASRSSNEPAAVGRVGEDSFCLGPISSNVQLKELSLDDNFVRSVLQNLCAFFLPTFQVGEAVESLGGQGEGFERADSALVTPEAHLDADGSQPQREEHLLDNDVAQASSTQGAPLPVEVSDATTLFLTLPTLGIEVKGFFQPAGAAAAAATSEEAERHPGGSGPSQKKPANASFVSPIHPARRQLDAKASLSSFTAETPVLVVNLAFPHLPRGSLREVWAGYRASYRQQGRGEMDPVAQESVIRSAVWAVLRRLVALHRTLGRGHGSVKLTNVFPLPHLGEAAEMMGMPPIRAGPAGENVDSRSKATPGGEEVDKKASIASAMGAEKKHAARIRTAASMRPSQLSQEGDNPSFGFLDHPEVGLGGGTMISTLDTHMQTAVGGVGCRLAAELPVRASIEKANEGAGAPRLSCDFPVLLLPDGEVNSISRCTQDSADGREQPHAAGASRGDSAEVGRYLRRFSSLNALQPDKSFKWSSQGFTGTMATTSTSVNLLAPSTMPNDLASIIATTANDPFSARMGSANEVIITDDIYSRIEYSLLSAIAQNTLSILTDTAGPKDSPNGLVEPIRSENAAGKREAAARDPDVMGPRLWRQRVLRRLLSYAQENMELELFRVESAELVPPPECVVPEALPGHLLSHQKDTSAPCQPPFRQIPNTWHPRTRIHPAGDIWQLGMLAVEMAEGSFPTWLENQHIPLPSLRQPHWSFHFNFFVRRCLTADPAQRPTAAELLSDPWFSARLTWDKRDQRVWASHVASSADPAPRTGRTPAGLSPPAPLHSRRSHEGGAARSGKATAASRDPKAGPGGSPLAPREGSASPEHTSLRWRSVLCYETDRSLYDTFQRGVQRLPRVPLPFRSATNALVAAGTAHARFPYLYSHRDGQGESYRIRSGASPEPALFPLTGGCGAASHVTSSLPTRDKIVATQAPSSTFDLAKLGGISDSAGMDHGDGRGGLHSALNASPNRLSADEAGAYERDTDAQKSGTIFPLRSRQTTASWISAQPAFFQSPHRATAAADASFFRCGGEDKANGLSSTHITLPLTNKLTRDDTVLLPHTLTFGVSPSFTGNDARQTNGQRLDTGLNSSRADRERDGRGVDGGPRKANTACVSPAKPQRRSPILKQKPQNATAGQDRQSTRGSRGHTTETSQCATPRSRRGSCATAGHRERSPGPRGGGRGHQPPPPLSERQILAGSATPTSLSGSFSHAGPPSLAGLFTVAVDRCAAEAAFAERVAALLRPSPAGALPDDARARPHAHRLPNLLQALLSLDRACPLAASLLLTALLQNLGRCAGLHELVWAPPGLRRVLFLPAEADALRGILGRGAGGSSGPAGSPAGGQMAPPAIADCPCPSAFHRHEVLKWWAASVPMLAGEQTRLRRTGGWGGHQARAE